MAYKVIQAFSAGGVHYQRGDVIPESVCYTWRNVGLMNGVYIVEVDDNARSN